MNAPILSLSSAVLVLRRGMIRVGEIYAIGAISDAANIIPSFNDEVYGPNAAGYALIGLALSAVVELVVLSGRPESQHCESDEPELPF